MGGKGGTANGGGDGNDIKGWMKARNDHVRALRQNAARPGRAASASTSSASNGRDLRHAAGNLANILGDVAGLGRGTLHLVQGAAEGEQIAQHVLDPFYATLHPNSPAVRPLYDSAVEALHAGKAAALHPARALHRANVALNPGASPVAPTVAAEAQRRFGIGQNQGEVAFDVLAGMAAPEAMATRALPAEEQAARWMDKGLTEPQARYMAEPYVGMGHHYYPRGAKLPSKLGPVLLPKFLADRPMPLPKALSDSPFNVLKPQGISRADMYEKHYRVDPDFKVARLPRRLGKSWQGKALGIQKHGPIGRVVHGAPPALKRTVSAAASGASGMAPNVHREDGR